MLWWKCISWALNAPQALEDKSLVLLFLVHLQSSPGDLNFFTAVTLGPRAMTGKGDAGNDGGDESWTIDPAFNI